MPAQINIQTALPVSVLASGKLTILASVLGVICACLTAAVVILVIQNRKLSRENQRYGLLILYQQKYLIMAIINVSQICRKCVTNVSLCNLSHCKYIAVLI